MKAPRSLLAAAGLVALALATPAIAQNVPPYPYADDTEALTRGPVHEAFASPVSLDPSPGALTPKPPPPEISERPPEVGLRNSSAQWIPGYWQWDDDRNDFIWISAILRNAPPNQWWVPGEWVEDNNGYRRLPGFWAPAGQELAYLPAPPASKDTGPTSDSPSPNHFWVPGYWVYQNHQYQWKEGHWGRAQQDWIWTPAHYRERSQGFVFVPGFWDYPLDERGLLFAPVYFRTPVYRQPRFYYVPSVLIRVERLLFNLFARPRYQTYYFGDYFGPSYANTGFYPWFNVGSRTQWYDPIYTYQAWKLGRNDPNWVASYRQQFDQRVARAELRPAQTFAQQGKNVQADADLQLGLSINEALKDRNFSNRVRQVQGNERREIRQPDKIAAPSAKADDAKPPQVNRLPKVERPIRVDPPQAEKPLPRKPSATPETPPLNQKPPQVEKPKLETPLQPPTDRKPPNIDAPRKEIPSRPVNPPKLEKPKLEKPSQLPKSIETPKVDPPKVEKPKREAPSSPPKLEVPRQIEKPKLETPAKPPKIESPPKMEKPKMEAPSKAPKVEAPRRVEKPKMEAPPKSDDKPRKDPNEKKGKK